MCENIYSTVGILEATKTSQRLEKVNTNHATKSHVHEGVQTSSYDTNTYMQIK